MLGAYREVIRARGAPAFAMAGFLLRIPIAMYPVALVLLVTLSGGSYARGGLLTAGFILGSALGNPLLSRFADRAGQRAVILPAATAHLLALVATVWAVDADAPAAVEFVLATLLGLSFVPVGALVRARWIHALGRSRQQLGTALSLESILDEVSYIVGPLLAAALATSVGSLAPFALITLLVLVGGGVLHREHVSAPPAHGSRQAATGRLPRVTVLIVLTMVAIGVTLISIDLAAIAYVGQAGLAGWTGAVLSCFATGSALAGLGYGLVHWQTSVVRRLPLVAAAFAVLPALLLPVGSVPQLAAALFVVGMGTAPLLTTVFGVLEQVSPPDRLTEVLAGVTTGLNIGAGLAAPAVGAVADAAGAGTALAMPLAVALVTGVLALVTAVACSRHRRG